MTTISQKNGIASLPIAAFARFADAEAMGNLLWKRFAPGFNGQDLPTACTIVYARYKHLKAQSQLKSSLSVCYRLDVAGRRAGNRRIVKI